MTKIKPASDCYKILFISFINLLFITGCFLKPEIREVEVPVEIPVAVGQPVYPPADLLEIIKPEALPQWLPPAAPEASSCLSVDSERLLKALLLRQIERQQALRAWAGNQRAE